MMVKEVKFFRKQADEAERMARATADEKTSQSLTSQHIAVRRTH
jgi:hypothetical protein